MLALAVVGIAAVIAVVTVIERLVLAIVVRKLTSGADVVAVRGSIGRAGSREVRVRVQRKRSMCRWCWRRPWRSRWIPVSLSCRVGALLKRFGLVGTLSKSGLVSKAGRVGGGAASGKQCIFQSFVSYGNLGIQDFEKRDGIMMLGDCAMWEEVVVIKAFFIKATYMYKTMSILASSSRPNLGKLSLRG